MTNAAWGQDGEHEGSEKLQEGGFGSSGLTMFPVREEAHRDERPTSRRTDLLRRSGATSLRSAGYRYEATFIDSDTSARRRSASWNSSGLR